MQNSDFSVVIALDEEFDDFAAALVDSGASVHPDRNDARLFSFELPSGGDQPARGNILLIKQAGPFAALKTVQSFVTSHKTTLMVNIGISGAMDDDLNLGDVVVATECFEYGGNMKAGASDGAGSPDIQFEVFRTDKSLREEATMLKHRRPELYNHWLANSKVSASRYLDEGMLAKLRKSKIRISEPSLYAGPVVSGPYVVADERFKSNIKKGIRKVRCVDQESAQVMNAVSERPEIKTLVIRCISDNADSHKGDLESTSKSAIRHWAIWNGISLFQSIISQVSFDGGRCEFIEPIDVKNFDHVQRQLHALAIQYYLPPQFRDEPTPDTLAHYAETLSHFTTRNLRNRQDLFADLRGETARPTRNASYILGDLGAGKTALISLFYWYLRRGDSLPGDIVPIYVSTKWIRGQDKDKDGVVKMLENSFLDLLGALIKCAKHRSVWVLVDAAGSSDQLAQRINNVLWGEGGSDNCRLVVSARTIHDHETSKIVFRFSPLGSGDAAIGALSKAFLSATSVSTATSDQLQSALVNLGHPKIDFFILSKAIRHGLAHEATHCDISEFMRIIVRNELEINDDMSKVERHKVLSSIGGVAYQVRIEGNKEVLRESEPRIRVFLEQHSLLQEYLAARYIVARYEEATNDVTLHGRALTSVFPYYVNRFVKAIVNRKDRDDRRSAVLDSVQLILDDQQTSFHAKSNAIYIAGRISAPQFRERAKSVIALAKDILTKYEKSLRSTGNARRPRPGDQERRGFLLFKRTFLISSAYLGESRAQSEYLSMLLNDKEYDQLNRGFHLEYYGDIPYSVREPLVHVDQLQAFPNTFRELETRLSGGAGNSPIYGIELQTLCSLCLHRHVNGRLSVADRARMLTILKTAFELPGFPANLRGYFEFGRGLLRKDDASLGDLLFRFLDVKHIPRSGWKKRGIHQGESVGEHISGACLLGVLTLPDSVVGDSSYNKTEILRMIQIHDIAEAITGDLLPDEKTKSDSDKELTILRNFRYLSLFEGVPDLRWIGDLAEEFETGKTSNAQYARELDKLDNLCELYRLRAEGKHIADFSEFEEDLMRFIWSESGKRAVKWLRAKYHIDRSPIPQSSDS